MALTSSNPKAGWSWIRYVDRGQGLARRSDRGASIDTAQHHQRAGPDVDAVALLHRLAFAEPRFPGDRRGVGRRAVLGPQRQTVGVEDDDPVIAPVAVGNGERQVL